MAPTTGSLLERGAAAVCESRFGGGSLYFRYSPGNLRFVDDFPEDTIVVRRDRFLELGDVPLDEVCSRLVEAGEGGRYTPDTVLADRPEPLFGPRFRAATRHGLRRGRHVRAGGRHVRVTTLLPVALIVFAASAPFAFALGGVALELWLVAAVAYGFVLLAAGILAAVKFHSLAVGGLAIVGLLGTHVAFGAGFVRGLFRR